MKWRQALALALSHSYAIILTWVHMTHASILGVQTKPSFVTYPLLYFTTNFCESTFSMSSPAIGRVGDHLGARHHMIRFHSGPCERPNLLKAVVDICLPVKTSRLFTFVKRISCNLQL